MGAETESVETLESDLETYPTLMPVTVTVTTDDTSAGTRVYVFPVAPFIAAPFRFH